MTQFDLVAMGGTFDLIHAGHVALLTKSFSISSKVIIGLSSDQLAEKRGEKPPTCGNSCCADGISQGWKSHLKHKNQEF